MIQSGKVDPDVMQIFKDVSSLARHNKYRELQNGVDSSKCPAVFSFLQMKTFALSLPKQKILLTSVAL